MKTLGRLFLGMAVFLIIGGTVYVIFSDESAGKVLLLLAAGLGLIIGGYLELNVTATAADGAEEPEEGLYLPHASIWPFWLGVGSLVIANGFALGLWGLIPGAILMGLALLGFARQSRLRA
jgi:hypothetical protein